MSQGAATRAGGLKQAFTWSCLMVVRALVQRHCRCDGDAPADAQLRASVDSTDRHHESRGRRGLHLTPRHILMRRQSRTGHVHRIGLIDNDSLGCDNSP